MSSSSLRRFAAVYLATTCIVGFAAEAAAQIEEIVVTTRKRSENLQDVPIVVTAFSNETMQRKGIADIEDITKYTPGLSYDEGFSKQDTRISIRGLSPTRGRQNAAVLMDDVDISSESIATAGGSFLVNPRLFDIERVEVVKGPHSALYGRSAFAGAISYVTRKPGDQFTSNAALEVASYNKLEGRVSASGPVIADRLSIGGALALWDVGGQYRSTVTGRYLGGNDGHGYSLSAVWTPTDILKFTVRGERSKDHYDPEARGLLNPGLTTLTLPASAVGQGIPGITTGSTTARVIIGRIPDASGLLPPSPSRNPRTGLDYPGSDRTLESIYLRTDVDLNFAELVALSFYRNADVVQFNDVFPNGDATTTNAIQEAYFVTGNHLLSQDIRLQSNDENSPLKWTVGGLYWAEVARQTTRNIACIYITGGCATLLSGLGVTRPDFVPAPNVFFRDTHHHSLYGSIDYEVTESITLSAELRRTWEDEKITSAVANIIVGCSGAQRLQAGPNLTCLVPGPPVQSASVRVFSDGSTTASTQTRSSFYTPRFTAEYAIDDDRMLYVSAGKGQKPGGSLSLLAPAVVNNVADFSGTKFKSEILWVYEAGIKAEWLEGRARTNADVYWQDFKNKQETGTRIGNDGLPVAGPGNAEKVRVRGFEFDGTLAVSENLTTSLGYSYIDSKYIRFSLVQTTATNIALAGNCTVVRPANGTPFCSVDYSGRRLVLSPKHSGNISLNWTQDFTSEVKFFVEADGRYMGSRFASFDNQQILNSFTTVDMRTGLRSDKWQITAYVNNLLKNDEITAAGFSSPNFQYSFIIPTSPGTVNSFLSNLPDKRQFGLRASYTF